MLRVIVQGGKALMMSRQKIGLVVLVLALGVWVPGASFAELAKWDQERVTALAGELAEATNALHTTFVKEPPATVGSGQSRDYYRLRQMVRRIRSDARNLSSSLANGEGYDETLPIYESLMVSVRDARETAKRTFTSNFVLDKAAAAGDVLRRIAPYYDPNALSGGD
jgi:hypothetical protein